MWAVQPRRGRPGGAARRWPDGRVAGGARQRADVPRLREMLAAARRMDALVIVPRICGICSVSQSVAAARALGRWAGVGCRPTGARHQPDAGLREPGRPPDAFLPTFFMPDFARPPTPARLARRRCALRAAGGAHRVRVRLPRRAAALVQLMGTLGGKWPHAGHPAGRQRRAVDRGRALRLLARCASSAPSSERPLFGAPLERWRARLGPRWPPGARRRRARRPAPASWLADDLAAGRLGRGPGPLLSYGAYRQPGGGPWLRPAAWGQAARRLAPSTGRHPRGRHARLAGRRPRRRTRARADRARADKPGGYTWNKAPRGWAAGGRDRCIARQLAHGHPLRAAVAHGRQRAHARAGAPAGDGARAADDGAWLAALVPREPSARTRPSPADGEGVGLTDGARRAARWAWLAAREAAACQLPDRRADELELLAARRAGTPGALEQALVGAPGGRATDTPVAVQHIVRSPSIRAWSARCTCMGRRPHPTALSLRRRSPDRAMEWRPPGSTSSSKMDEVYSQLVRDESRWREERRARAVAAVHLQPAHRHERRAGGLRRAGADRGDQRRAVRAGGPPRGRAARPAAASCWLPTPAASACR